jgi:diadenosine tetraphosphate (Ap4A) HIT family hydrolase
MGGSGTRRTWPADWFDRKAGRGCPICGDDRAASEDPLGNPRIFAGEHADAYLQREAVQRGYAVVVWRGRHVAEPTELAEPEMTCYWREVLVVARALAAHYEPAQINYEIHGNSVPHLHTHVQARFLDDSGPGRPLDLSVRRPLPEGPFQADVEALRALLSHETS